jgi:MFS family permease
VFRHDLTAASLAGGLMWFFQYAAALGVRRYGATEFHVALIHSSFAIGLLLSLFSASRAVGRRSLPFVVIPEAIGRLSILGILFVPRDWTIAYVLIVVWSWAWNVVGMPVRTVIYRAVYPDDRRAALVGYTRAASQLVQILVGLAGRFLIEWNDPSGDSFDLLTPLAGPCPLDPGTIQRWIVVPIGLVALFGTRQFAWIARHEPDRPVGTPVPFSFSLFLNVLRENRRFLRYQSRFFWFGFANLMLNPVVTLYISDPAYGVDATEADVVMLTSVVTFALMTLTTPVWGRLLDRYNPVFLRSWLNLFWSFDILILILTPRVEWLYVSRVIRGIAWGGGQLLWMLGSLYFAPREKAALYQGAHTFLTGVRGFVGPFVGSALLGWIGMRPTMALGWAMMVASGVALLLASREEPLHVTPERRAMPPGAGPPD